MISYFFKGILIDIGFFILKFFPKKGIFRKLHRVIYLRKLSRIDSPAAAAEYARDSGVKIGKDCRIYGSGFGREGFLIELGDNVLISGDVSFITHDGGPFIVRNEIKNLVGNYGKIKIGNNCFIGAKAIILPNVQIGDNCIIGAGAVVADSFPDNSVIVGNPAKLIFNTDLYLKMKLSSKLTITNDECSYPESDYLPYEIRKKIIMDQIGDIPIRKPRNVIKK